MRRIRSTDMKPELVVRSLLHRLGYRYRLHCKELPGKPDIVFRSRQAVIFVHGCFWHQHSDPNCSYAHVPKSNTSYWKPKLERNQARDLENEAALIALGWRVLVIWECQIKDDEALKQTLLAFLNS